MMIGRVTLDGLRYVAGRLGLLVIFGVILFWSAGQWDWLRGWLYLLAAFLSESCTLALLAVRAPETLNQRGSRHSGVKSFDKVFALLWLLLALGAPVVAGFDAVRFRWSTLPWSAFYAGLGVLLLATALGTWAMLENEYFELCVRIQKDRRHRVVTTGPYRYVRHPGYLGAALGALTMPLMLGSAYAFLPAGMAALLFVVRTVLEDNTLRLGLSGYEEYTKRTPFRLIPFLW